MKRVFMNTLYLLTGFLLLTHCNTPTDSDSDPQTLTFKEIWFSDSEDLDEDGYNSYARLNIDMDVNKGAMDVIIEVGIRVHDPADTSYYYLYATSPVISVDGSSEEDARYLGIDNLPQSGFDFLILAYKSSDMDNPIAEAAPQTHSVLGNVPFEIANTDASLEIFDVFWADNVDKDGDGFSSEALMGVDVDVLYGMNSVAFLAIYSKLSSASTYNLITVSDTFTVSGESSGDAVGFRLVNFPHNTYDFLVNAYYYDGIDVEDQFEKTIDSDMGNVKLETAEQDMFEASLSHYDGSFEDAIWYTSGDFSSQTMFVVGFDKPVNADSCFVKSISIRISSDPAAVKLRVLGTESNLYTPALDVYVNTGWNAFDVNVDVSNDTRFFAGYLQTQVLKPKLSIDTTAPHSGASYWHDGAQWVSETERDYGIAVQIAYTLDGGPMAKPVEWHTKWLPASIGSKSGQTNQVSVTDQ